MSSRQLYSSLEIGIVPKNWKVALIAPLLKKLGLELVNQNFRPVRKLPLVSKTAEKAVVPHLLAHCTEHSQLYLSFRAESDTSQKEAAPAFGCLCISPC